MHDAALRRRAVFFSASSMTKPFRYEQAFARNIGWVTPAEQAILRNKRVDVAVSQSSFHSPVVARLMGIRSIYLNDNEHAVGNVPAFACADQIMVPEFLATDSLTRQGARLRWHRRLPPGWLRSRAGPLRGGGRRLRCRLPR